jgi:hypothetical protein
MTAAPRIMLSCLIFLVNMEITVLVNYKKFRYLSRMTAAPRIMLSWLVFLDLLAFSFST